MKQKRPFPLFKQPRYGAYRGVFCALTAFLISYLLFSGNKNIVGISTVIFATLLALPFFTNLFMVYEKKTLRTRWERVLHTYKPLINYLTSFFVGMFVTFFILALINPQLVFSREDLLGVEKQWQRITFMLPPPPGQQTIISDIFSIFWHNTVVLLISFALSLFFGAGALFLIALNTSIFAAALAHIIYVTIPLGVGFTTAYALLFCNISIMFLHTLPEATSYLIAALAGAILGQAVMTEKFRLKTFSFLGKDIFITLFIAEILLLIAAIIEITLSKPFFTTYLCLRNTWVTVLIALLLLSIIIIFDWCRRRHVHKR